MQIASHSKPIRIVSRKSRLALVQATLVQQKLQELYPKINTEIIGVSTSGDEILDQPLNKIGGKGLFVKELENYLLDNRADIAVHSMKDVPAALPDGLALSAIMARADPRDVLCSSENHDLLSLPQNAIVGSSSLRRQAQLLAVRPDLTIIPLRGNVETRLQKLEAGEFNAIILAAAGLKRLNLQRWLQQPINVTQMLPAVGQGALGIEHRAADADIAALIAPLNNESTASCVTAERAMNRLLDGGCQAPVAGYATIVHGMLYLSGLVATADGSIIYRAQHKGEVEDALDIGETVATQLIAQGAAEIIQALKDAGQIYG
jgi:hydroxymethylbilane synthase